MAVVLSQRRELVRKIQARCNLTPQERANLLASHTPPALLASSSGGHVRR